jgi:serine/threonine-protein kinase
MSLLAELRRRNVYRAAVFYAASAWLLVQVATQVFPLFHIAEWVLRWIVVAAVVGLPFALGFAWFYELTPQGLRRESEVAPAESITRTTGKKLDRWIIAVLAAAVVLLLTDRFVLRKDTSAISDKSIAVLPLVNESGDPKDDYFSDGLSEDLINALTQLNGLRVIGRNSSFQFRGKADDPASIGSKLGVASLLEGSVRRLGDRLRVSATLIRAADGSQAWAHSYDRDYKDVFDVQAEIAQSVAQALELKLLGENKAPIVARDRPPHGNLQAYEAYLQGKFYEIRGNKPDWLRAIDRYQQALNLEPGYPLALAHLSMTWVALGGQSGGKEAADAFAAARSAAQQALALDPNLADAHVVLGWLLHDGDLNFAGARVEFQRAAELAPELARAQDGVAQSLADFAQVGAAVAAQRQAVALDPLDGHLRDYLGLYLTAQGRLDEAEGALHKAVEFQPGLYAVGARLTTIALLRGDATTALREAERTADPSWKRYALALARAGLGDRAAADAALQAFIEQDAEHSAFQIADVYAFRKQPDEAFSWLDRALANRDPGISELYVYPFMFSLHSDPRFAAFCRKIGLPASGEKADAAAKIAAADSRFAISPASERMP